MTPEHGQSSDNTWALIEKGKRVDRFIRNVSIAAWSATLLMVLIFAIMTGLSVAQFVKAAAAGDLPWLTALGAAMPFIIAVGGLFVLIAVLSTVLIFLRMRTASLSEIQLRLAALEDMLASRADSDQARGA